MANYYESTRTNYFRVKDEKTFMEYANGIPSSEVVRDSEGRFAFLFGEEGVPSSIIVTLKEEDGTEYEEYDDFDFIDSIIPFIAEDSVVILMGSGAEKLRYVSGYATAVNSKGEIASINLDEIYARAKKLGGEVTRAEY